MNNQEILAKLKQFRKELSTIIQEGIKKEYGKPWFRALLVVAGDLDVSISKLSKSSKII